MQKEKLGVTTGKCTQCKGNVTKRICFLAPTNDKLLRMQGSLFITTLVQTCSQIQLLQVLIQTLLGLVTQSSLLVGRKIA